MTAVALTDVITLSFRCSDCKNLDPEINKAADTLERRSGDIAKVDCFGAGKGLCEMYRVKSWPQLKLFKKGNYIGEYTGAQTGGNLQFHLCALVHLITEMTYVLATPADFDFQAFNNF